MSIERPAPPPSYIDVQGPRDPPSYSDLNLQPAVVGQPQGLPEQAQLPQTTHVSSIPEDPSPVDSRRNPPSQSVSFAPETSLLNIGIRRNPPCYNEVLEAEGTGRFRVVGRRTPQVMQFYRRNNDDWTSNSDSSCCRISYLTVVIPLVFLFSVPIPLTMGIMGVIHINDCPMDNIIPVFMASSGFLFTAIIVLLLIVLKLSRKRAGDGVPNVSLACTLSIVFLFSFVFIAFQLMGSAVVFMRWKRFSKDYESCYTDIFLYAFSLLIIFWLLLPLACGIGICCGMGYIN